MKLYPNNFFFRNATSEENVQYDLKKRAEITDCCLLRSQMKWEVAFFLIFPRPLLLWLNFTDMEIPSSKYEDKKTKTKQ